jgi:polar amino acid transport system substrate-binding protein
MPTGWARRFAGLGWWSIAIALASPASAVELQFLTHRLAPFTIDAAGPPRGLAVDLVTELMRRTGDTGAITVTSFARVLEAVRMKTNVVGFVIARTPEREVTMQWVGPLAVSGVYVYKKAGSPVRLRTLDDLRRLDVVAVQLGNADDTYLTKLGFTNLTRPYRQIDTLALVLNGRAAATPISELVFPSLVAEATLPRMEFERTEVKLYDSRVFLGFSKHIDAAVIASWSAALEALRTSGRYDQIVAAYQPVN